MASRILALDLLHLPDEPAGVEEEHNACRILAVDLLHLPGKPAGVKEGGGIAG